MKILIAEDEAVSRTMLVKLLAGWGHEVLATTNGAEAWEALSKKDGPKLALLDWVMPAMDGIEVVRRVRQAADLDSHYVYIILLSQKTTQEEIVQGLEAGADDYIVKPYDLAELRVRIRTGERILELQRALIAANQELRQALGRVKTLSGLLPICASCKNVRDDKGYWQQIEAYVRDHSEAEFSHSICPSCFAKLYPEFNKNS
jgi:DNA-binding response OmpR family regulator